MRKLTLIPIVIGLVVAATATAAAPKLPVHKCRPPAGVTKLTNNLPPHLIGETDCGVARQASRLVYRYMVTHPGRYPIADTEYGGKATNYAPHRLSYTFLIHPRRYGNTVRVALWCQFPRQWWIRFSYQLPPA